MNPGLAPQRVTIIRPKLETSAAAGRLLGHIGQPFFAAWIAMLLLGNVTDWGLSYWATLAIVIIVRVLLPERTSDYTYWTLGANQP